MSATGGSCGGTVGSNGGYKGVGGVDYIILSCISEMSCDAL